MTNNISISVKNVTKTYKLYDTHADRVRETFHPLRKKYHHPFNALTDVSFDVNKGETLGIIGRNGSGKSTLLQIICGILQPTSGSVEVNGRVSALLELGAGFNPEFTGRQNVYINGSILGLKHVEIENRFDEIAAFADIGQFIEQPVKTYSSGMLLRLAFAVQATVEPDILIVDEALAVGDEKFQRKCFARLEALKNRGTSILFVSHSGPQVIELCDRAILLDNGIRLLCAKPMQVVRAYQKLIYAPPAEQKRLVNEYLSSDWNEDGDEQQREKSPSVIALAISGDSFDPGLIPETTTIYPVQGAEIQKIQILDVEGRAVNVLQLGREYQFVSSGRFLADVEGVYFGIHMRSISGMEITDQRYPEEGKSLDGIKAGANFKMIFGFKMLALPGVYFVGGGVWSSVESTCCHRILDALMFRVSPDQKNNSFVYTDASSKEPYLELF